MDKNLSALKLMENLLVVFLVFFTSEEIVQSVSGVHFDRIMTKLVAVTEELLRSFVFSQATSTFKFFRPKICF